MSVLKYLIDVFLHLDVHLADVMQQYGILTYGILFAIVFCETGLVVMPFLPGDSLLFAAGALTAATGILDVRLLLLILLIAPLIGDQVNYWVARLIGVKLPFAYDSRIFNKKYLDKTHDYYEKYGGKTIIIARFVPIVRTFAPFVAGLGRMNYLRFLSYSVIGACLWVSSFVLAGFFFGNIELVRKNFTLVVMAIIVISLLPGILEFWRHRRSS